MIGKTGQPLVSIITVVYNGEKYIEQTIKSVLDQSYQNIEYIVIDGASTDNTLTIIQRYASRITHLLSEPDQGLYYAMNKAIGLAKGEIIGILNAGDFYLKNTVERIVEANKKAEANLFYGDWITATEHEGHCSFKREYSDINQMNYKQSIAHPTCFIKKIVYENIGLFNTKYKLASDYDFLLRCIKNGVRFQHIPKVITICRPGGLSNSYKCDFEAFKIQKEHKIPNPYKYIYRGVKCYSKSLIKKTLFRNRIH